jgi:hypothetical protein
LNLHEFATDFVEQRRVDAAINQTDAADEFINYMFEYLHDMNFLDDPTQFYFGKQGRRQRFMQIDGYCFDEADKSLILIISDFEDSLEIQTLTNSQIESLYKKMLYFLDEACNGNIEEYCDDADDTIKLARLIRNRVNALDNAPDQVLKIQFYIVSNKKLSDKVKKLKQSTFNEKPVEVNIWNIERLYEAELANNNEPIYMDIPQDFSYRGIPCIKGEIGENLEYCAYIAILPGKLLADIYVEYGSKVLEGNVRAFLGASGLKSVNSGIRNTIIKEPTKFFTYNNGIAATASRVEIENKDGELLITAIEDLQIINGGQTTASLAEAVLKKTNIELEGIFVPMKLTVIEDRDSVDEEGIRFYDAMVEKIARYANSQNKVTAADFFSNSPFHVLMEKMSKKHLAPPVNGNPNPTGWYYERTKKKYNQEQMKMTKAEKDRFAIKFPKKQLIKKEELAKYVYAVECRPDIVAKGGNFAIKAFGAAINEMYKINKAQFNEFYFKKMVVYAIIFRTIDGYLDRLKKIPDAWYKTGGYKSCIVPYTIAKIMSAIPKDYSLDWNLIWNQQTLYPELMKEIEKVTKFTNDFICDSHGVIVTEYCKKEDTWNKFRREVEYKPSDEFIYSLISTDLVKEDANIAKREQKQANDIAIEVKVIELGSEYWKRLLSEGMSNNLLSYKEISQLKIAVEFENTGNLPTASQAKAIMNIRTKLDRNGVFV